MTSATKCPACGFDTEHVITLDDGTEYCPIARLAVDDALEMASVPDVTTTAELDSHQTIEQIASHDVPPSTEPPSGDALDVPNRSTGSEATGAAPISDPDPAVQTGKDNEHGAAPAPPNEGGPNFGALKLIIGLTLRAGLASLDANNNPVEPPTGWMPPPASDIPEVEAGAAMAVALMIRTFGIDHADVIALTKQFLDTDNETETTQ